MVRRTLQLVVLLGCAGCPLPEDGFVLSGRATLFDGTPLADVEVQLARNRVASETRCDQLEPLAVTRTGPDGRYSFSLIRQQVTAGVEGRRFFSVSRFDGVRRFTQRFWFPDADLELGDLGVQPVDAWSFNETRLDGHLAWRSEDGFFVFGGNQPDRPFEGRAVSARREWRTVPIDSLGRYDLVPVETRAEEPWVHIGAKASALPPGRGAECPFIDVTPCPLTDGRFLPYFFPPETRTLVFNFHQETSVKNLGFHGLVLERPAAKARFDFNFFVDYGQWNPMISAKLDGQLQALSSDQCDEPGVFLDTVAGGFAQPVIFRVSFEDEAGALVPIVSLQEMTAR